jgi:hypothetical protein
MRLKVSEKLVIRGYEFAVFPLGQRHVQAIVESALRPGGNIDRTVVQGVDGMQNRRGIQDIKDEQSGPAQVNQFLPLRLGQAVGDLAGEVGRRDQFMDVLLVFIAQLQGSAVAEEPSRTPRKRRERTSRFVVAEQVVEPVIIDDSVDPPDFLGDRRGALMHAPGNLRIERLAPEGMAEDGICIRLLLKVKVIGARFDAHAGSLADQAKPGELPLRMRKTLFTTEMQFRIADLPRR